MKKATTEYIADALNELEDVFIVEAATYRAKRIRKWWYPMSFAAACAVTVCVILYGTDVWDRNQGKTSASMNEECFAALDATWKKIAWEDVLLQEGEETDLENKQGFAETENRIEQAVGNALETTLEKEQVYETWERLKGTVTDCQLYQLEGKTERYFAVLTVKLTEISHDPDLIGDTCRIYINIESLESFPTAFLEDETEHVFYVTPVTAQMGEHYEGHWFRYADVAEYILEVY